MKQPDDLVSRRDVIRAIKKSGKYDSSIYNIIRDVPGCSKTYDKWIFSELEDSLLSTIHDFLKCEDDYKDVILGLRAALVKVRNTKSEYERRCKK